MSSSGLAAVALELFTHRFAAIARQMGERLQRTAVSTNVKERLDFSCAVLDPQGELVVNAPHIPVHLGALGLCVRLTAAALPLGPGDVAVTNHPGFGGSHLPDVTVITPVFDEPGESGEIGGAGSAAVHSPSAAAGALLGYVASRAHHAEIGGMRPGSMPPAARCLAEEGVVIAPTYLVRRGEARWAEMRRLLTGGPFPTRAVEENLADLRAAMAANHRGAEALRGLARAAGAAVVAFHMEALKEHAADLLRAALRRLPAGVLEASERLDDGAPLAVRFEIRPGGSALIDFAGSAGVHPGNLNAPPAVLRSAVLYVMRLLVAEPLPLNEGLLRPLEIRVPPGLLAPPFPADPWQAPAVVGGNVETSQRLVDTLLKALGLAACSQGTMNNVLFGNDRFGYYETVCGGAGAGPAWDGASGVHTHMTNTRITDPEVLEHRYPVRLERFGLRRGSGGAGARRGGDGVVRELTFLAPVALSLLTQHRVERPYGVAGGEPGQPGRQRLHRRSGEVLDLASIAACDAAAGDRLVLETPGGGGWGAPDSSRQPKVAGASELKCGNPQSPRFVGPAAEAVEGSASRVLFDEDDPGVLHYIRSAGGPAQTLRRCGQHYHLPVEHLQGGPDEVTPRDRHLVAGATPPLASVGAIVEIHTVYAAGVASPCGDPEGVGCCSGQALVLAYHARVVPGGDGPIPARPPGFSELVEYSGSTTGPDLPEEAGCKPPAQWSFARGQHFTVGQEQLRRSFPWQGAQEARPLQNGDRLSDDLTVVR